MMKHIGRIIVVSTLLITGATVLVSFPLSSKPFHQRAKPAWSSSSSCLLVLHSVNENQESSSLASSSSSSSQDQRAIGDVVQGLHGSKYQFSDAGINFEGQQFAEMGYSSSSGSDQQQQQQQQESYQNEPIPQWALRMKEQTILPPNASELVLKDGTAFIQIQNDE